MGYDELSRIADEARENSYCIYSNFSVGAALLTKDGRVYKGCNIENASYPAGLCAERNAIFHAGAEGERHIKAIVIIGGANGVITDYCPPCGVCRQVMREFCRPENLIVIMAKSPDDYIEKTLEELLPLSFGPDHLK